MCGRSSPPRAARSRCDRPSWKGQIGVVGDVRLRGRLGAEVVGWIGVVLSSERLPSSLCGLRMAAVGRLVLGLVRGASAASEGIARRHCELRCVASIEVGLSARARVGPRGRMR